MSDIDCADCLSIDEVQIPAKAFGNKKIATIRNTDLEEHLEETCGGASSFNPVTDAVTPTNWQRKEKAVRAKAGWKVGSDLVDPPEPPESAPAWPQNALRHTAASVALAMGKPIESLIFEHGHSGGTALLRRHYIGRIPK